MKGEKKDTKTGKLVRCPSCKHEWVYMGFKKRIVSCPSCRTSLSLLKHALEKEETLVGQSLESPDQQVVAAVNTSLGGVNG